MRSFHHDCCFELPGLPRRRGAHSRPRWICFFHHSATRATPQANQPRHQIWVIDLTSQHPVQPHGQAAGHCHLCNLTSTPEFQPLIQPPQFRIPPGCCLSGFHQQPTHHRIALLADRPDTRPSARTVQAWIQTQITAHVPASWKTVDRAHRQHECQRGQWPHARMRHQASRLPVRCRLLLDRAIQLGNRFLPLIEPVE
jgi:hypothetical protein